MTYDRFAIALSDFLAARTTLNSLPPSVTNDVETACGDAFTYAEDRLISTPAKTVSDLRAKMEVIWNDPAALPTPETIRAVMADVHALTDHEPSRIFDAPAWLAWFEQQGGGWIEREGEIILLIPDKSDLNRMDDIMHELAACDGRDAVCNVIRERSREKLAA